MIKHHGIGSAGHANDGADRRGSRGHREHCAGAAGIVPAVGCDGPGGVGGWFGGGSYVNGDRAIAFRPVWECAVAGVDGECGKNSDIAGWGSAGSEDGGAAEVGARGSTVATGDVREAGEGCNFRIRRAPGEGRTGHGDSQGIDCGRRDGYAAAVIYCDRVPSLALAPDLEVDGLDQTGRVRKGAAGGPRDAGKKVGNAGGLGGGLSLVEHVGLIWGHEGNCGDHTGVARRPTHGADGVGDVHVVAVGDPLELPGLPLGKAVIRGRLGLGLCDLNAVDVLVDVDGRGWAADALDDRSDDGDPGSSGTAKGGAGIPGAGAGGAIAGDREWCGGVRVTAGDNKLNADADYGAAVDIRGAGAEELSAANVDGEVGGWVQRNGLHCSAIGVGTAFAKAAGEGDDKGDDQSKKKTGTATTHEPSSRPFARRERNNVVGRKTVSVEGHWDIEQAVKFR